MPLGEGRGSFFCGSGLALFISAFAGPLLAQAQLTPVSALGRLEPEHGIVRIAAPSTPQSVSGSVLKKLLVDEGDHVIEGQLLAITGTADLMEALVKEVEAELELARRQADSATSQAEEACIQAEVAEREAQRRADLLSQDLMAEEEAELARGAADARAAACVAGRTTATAAKANVDVAGARLARFQVDLQRCYVRSPMAGQVLDVLARPGELIQGGGILELGRVDRMYAIAEVYETDIHNVRVGQKAIITSDALDGSLSGTVERISLKVQKQDEIGADPAARKDARIIEVEILLDDPEPAAALTFLQVEVVIGS